MHKWETEIKTGTKRLEKMSNREKEEHGNKLKRGEEKELWKDTNRLRGLVVRKYT
jgi:hypothetical protein